VKPGYGPTPPRRYSVEQDVQKPDALRIGRFIEIVLDEKRQDHVISYDVDAGTVDRFVTDADGRVVLNAKGDEIRVETLHGAVEVRWKDEQPCLA
jgi:homogentisate 1,2-dioxygenase